MPMISQQLWLLGSSRLSPGTKELARKASLPVAELQASPSLPCSMESLLSVGREVSSAFPSFSGVPPSAYLLSLFSSSPSLSPSLPLPGVQQQQQQAVC